MGKTNHKDQKDRFYGHRHSADSAPGCNELPISNNPNSEDFSMSLENVIQENTATMKELISVIKASQNLLPAPEQPKVLPAPKTVEPASSIAPPSRAQAITALNKAIVLKGQDAVKAIFDRFGKARVSEYEPDELVELVAALEA